MAQMVLPVWDAELSQLTNPSVPSDTVTDIASAKFSLENSIIVLPNNNNISSGVGS